ncbi:hypothetical protein, partial [Kribbella deserti]
GALTKPLTGTISNTAANIALNGSDPDRFLTVAASGANASVVVSPNYAGCMHARATGVVFGAIAQSISVKLETNTDSDEKVITDQAKPQTVTVDLIEVDYLRFTALSTAPFQLGAMLTLLCPN